MNIKELQLKFKLNFSSITLLIVINVIFYLLSLILGATYGKTNALQLLGAEFLPDILNGQLWRFVLPAFLHAGIFHLILNMWALYHLGGAIETFYGHKKVIIVYILTGLSGSVFSVVATLLQIYFSQGNIEYSISVGSSAAVFGFVGLLLGNKFKKNTFSVSIDNYINTSQLWFFVGVNILFGLGVNFMGSGFAINNFAHIGGFLSGILLGMILDLVNTTYQSRSKVILEKALFILALLLLILSFIGQLLYFVFSILYISN
jgi:rhomboid protease GluP